MSDTAYRWPALMDLPTVADYLKMTPGVAAGVLQSGSVHPVELGVRAVRWSREDVDAFLQALPRRGGPARTWASDHDTIPGADSNAGVEYALAAVERRSDRRRQAAPARRSREVRQSRPTP